VDLKGLGLNERQIEALRLMVNERRELSNKDYREMFDVSNVTAYTDLSQLVDLGYVTGVGKGRARQYRAART
jgi:DeoR/GlpR family transcriptional regulator of sugar metabolism